MILCEVFYFSLEVFCRPAITIYPYDTCLWFPKCITERPLSLRANAPIIFCSSEQGMTEQSSFEHTGRISLQFDISSSSNSSRWNSSVFNTDNIFPCRIYMLVGALLSCGSQISYEKQENKRKEVGWWLLVINLTIPGMSYNSEMEGTLVI